MATKPHLFLTPRDREVLEALDRTPLAAGQLHKLSRTFLQPFFSERMVRERLFALASVGWVRMGKYATTGEGAGQNYYQLARLGYQILYGPSAEPPTKRYFSPLSLARQHHTRALADFIVHMIVSAHAAGAAFTDFYRENTLKLAVGQECLYPDGAFQLLLPDGRTFNYLIELDNHTERIRSTKEADSWQRKIRLYDELQALNSNRFRVLIVTTRSGPRLGTILALAATMMSNPQRSLFLGIPLASFIEETNTLFAPTFLDHQRRSVPLVPPLPTAAVVASRQIADSAIQGVEIPC